MDYSYSRKLWRFDQIPELSLASGWISLSAGEPSALSIYVHIMCVCVCVLYMDWNSPARSTTACWCPANPSIFQKLSTETTSIRHETYCDMWLCPYRIFSRWKFQRFSVTSPITGVNARTTACNVKFGTHEELQELRGDEHVGIIIYAATYGLVKSVWTPFFWPN